MIDGLDFMFDNGTVFVTTRDILRATNKEFNSLSSNRKSLRFISQATDSSVASNWAIQLVSNGNATQSGALLVSRGQDLVPAPPNSLIVFLNTKTRVYLYEEQIVLKRQVYCEALFDYRNALATLSKYAYCFDKRLPKLVRKKYIAKSRKILEMLVSEQNAYEIKQLNN